MSTQPLTPRNPVIIIVAGSIALANDALVPYGIPTDAGNIEPTLTTVIITNMTELMAYLATVPSPTLPWTSVFKGNPTSNHQLILDSMTAYFGMRQNMSSCLAMLNNEYAIDPAKLRTAGA